MAQNPTNPVTGRSAIGSQSQVDWERPRDPGFESPTSKDDARPGLGEQIKEQAGSVLESAEGLAEDAKAKVQGAMEAGANKAEETKKAAGEQMHAVADKIRQGGEVVSEKADQLGNYLQEHDFSAIGRDLTDIVRRYPVQALLIGVGVGLLLGRAAR